MKKFLFILLALSVKFTGAFSQDTKGYISVAVGPGIPTGDFGSTDPKNSQAGLAKPGAVFDITFAHQLGAGRFGVVATLRGQANQVDAQAIADQLAVLLPGYLWTVEAKAWSGGGLLLGGYGTFPLSEKLSFDVKAMLGFESVSSPEITTTANYMGMESWSKQSSSSASALAYLFGADLKYKLGSKLYLITNVDYIGTKADFKDVEALYSDGTRDTTDFSQPVGTVNITLGLAYRF